MLNAVPQYLIQNRRKIATTLLTLFLIHTNLIEFFLAYCLQLITEVVIFHGVF